MFIAHMNENSIETTIMRTCPTSVSNALRDPFLKGYLRASLTEKKNLKVGPKSSSLRVEVFANDNLQA